MSLVVTCSQFYVGRHHGLHWKRPTVAIRHKNKAWLPWVSVLKEAFVILSLEIIKIDKFKKSNIQSFICYGHYWPLFGVSNVLALLVLSRF